METKLNMDLIRRRKRELMGQSRTVPNDIDFESIVDLGSQLIGMIDDERQLDDLKRKIAERKLQISASLHPRI